MKNDETVIIFLKGILIAIALYFFWRARLVFSGVNDLEDTLLLLCCVIAGCSYWIGKCILTENGRKVDKEKKS